MKSFFFILAYFIGMAATINLLFREHERPQDFAIFAAAMGLWVLSRDRLFPAQWQQAICGLGRYLRRA